MKEDVCNIPIWAKFHDIPITVFMNDRLNVIANKHGTPWMLDSYTAAMCTDSWGTLSYARAIIELRADVELKDTLVVAIPKFVDEGYTMNTICVEYARTPPKCSSCKVFSHVLDECPKKIVSDVLNNLKTSKQADRGVQVGPEIGFKPTKQVYQLVSKINGASSSGKKKQAGLTRQEVSTSNSFDMRITVESDDKLDTNGVIRIWQRRGPIMAEAAKKADNPLNEKKEINMCVPSSLCYKSPIEKEVNLTSTWIPSTFMGKRVEESDSDIQDLDDETT
ncbi:retrotransposon protein, putative, ty1-copia subclass [Tanacetum coccineum]